MDELDHLVEQARAGRGLWVGLALATELPFKLTVPDYPPIDDPHCTLHHFGKQAALLVAPALKVSQALAENQPPIDARVGGVARFSGSETDGDPVVWLLEAPIIRSLAAALRGGMTIEGASVRNSGYFDYKPHVTVTRVPRDHALTIPHPPKLTLTLRSVVVVCGDHRVYYPFQR